MYTQLWPVWILLTILSANLWIAFSRNCPTTLIFSDWVANLTAMGMAVGSVINLGICALMPWLG